MTGTNDSLRVVPDENGHLQLRYGPIHFGSVYQEIDGFYVFLPVPNRNGYWDSAVLSAIAKTLERLNEAWAHQIDHDLSGTPDLFEDRYERH